MGVPVFNPLAAAAPEIRVASVAALKSLPPLPTGTRVRVTASDQQAGLFEVLASTRATDICTCHPFDAHLSAVQSITIAKTALVSNQNYALPHQNIAFGTVKVYYDVVNNPNNHFTDLELHGHLLNPSTGASQAMIDHAAGTIRDHAGFLKSAIISTNVTITYQHVTSGTRLIRDLGDNDALNVEWTGCPYYLAGATPAADARDYICWAMRVAERLGLGEVHFPHWYSFYGTIEVPSLVSITGDNWLASGLRLVDGEGVKHYRTDFDTTEPRWKLGGRYSVLVLAGSSAGSLIRDIQIDGNLSGNIQWLTSPGDYVTQSTITSELQNTPVCNGIAVTNHGGRTVSNCRLQMERVWVHSCLSSCYLAGPYGSAVVSAGHVRVGASLRNHNFYMQCEASFCLVEMEGYAWDTGLVMQKGMIDKLVVKNITANPHFPWTILTQKRNASGTAHDLVSIGKFDIDMSAATGTGNIATTFFSVTGDNFRLGDGLVRLCPDISSTGQRLIVETQNGSQLDLCRGWSVGDIVIWEQGTARATILDTVATNNFDIATRDFRSGSIAVKAVDSTVNGAGSYFYAYLRAWTRNATWTQGKKINLRINSDSLRTYTFKTDVTSGATALDVMVQDSRWNNSGNVLMANPSNGHVVSGLTSAADVGLLRWFYENCEFNVYTANTRRLELFLATGYFRGCRNAQTGRTSEASGVFTLPSATGGETTALIQTNLWWAPSAFTVVPDSADARAAGISIVEVSNSGGTVFGAWVSGSDSDRTNSYLKVTYGSALTTGNNIRLRWSARIRHLGDPSLI